MHRFRTLVVVAALGAALAVAASAAAVVVPKLTGTVGPGFTITLKRGTAPVKLLKAGRYSITVADKSNIHNFHLKGPGAEQGDHLGRLRGHEDGHRQAHEGHGTRSICDPHATIMKGQLHRQLKTASAGVPYTPA